MIKSMTGFGSAEYQGADYGLHIEVRSVNHRYSDIGLHLPKGYHTLEDALRKLAGSYVKRGKLDIYISFDEHSARPQPIKVNMALATGYYNALCQLRDEFSLELPATADVLAAYPGVISFGETDPDTDTVFDCALSTAENALQKLVAMRFAEGEHIFEDLTSRINILENYVDAIEKRAPIVLAEYRTRLVDFLSDVQVEEARLAQEVVLFADKASITEELVRLASHSKQFRETLAVGQDAVGRKLDFIVQEMNREVNTVASKANDAVIAGLVVEIKSELEKIREQVQNIE